MLQAHSFLWHYLWVAPDALQLLLCFFLWKRRLIRHFPAFFLFILLDGLVDVILYAADLLPFVSGVAYFRMVWAEAIMEGVLKLAVIAEIFAKIFGAYASVARLGKVLIQWAGAILVFVAAWAAGYAPRDQFAKIIYGANLLEQSIFLIECGVLVLIFLLSSYFHLRWPRKVFGIALGLSISACVHLATWGLMTNAGLSPEKSAQLVFLNGGTFHIVVLLWFYYLLVPERAPVQTPAPLPENNLALWNRELERLLQQ
jgi:hypothetical protein